MSDLDSLLDSLAESAAQPSTPQPITGKPVSINVQAKAVAGDYDDTMGSDDEEPKAKAPVMKKYAAPVISAPSAVSAEDLDDLVADLERQDRRRLPAAGGLQVVGARKKTSRKQVKGALAGDDLDRIVDEINDHARRHLKANQATEKLGFGVINAERKFDLRAPKTATVSAVVECTIFVYTQSGERSRIPAKHFSVRCNGEAATGLRTELTDNKDGSYTIRFKPEREGKLYLEIDAYNERQFNWQIDISPGPEAKQCTAETQLPFRVNQQCTVIITARDRQGEQLKVGGAQFNLSFAGAGQLGQVGLNDLMNGTYSLQFVPDKVGQYAIFISLDSVDIKTHPLVFNVSA